MAQTLLSSNNEKTTAPGSAEPDDVKQKQKKALPGANGANDNVMGTKKNGHTPVRENTKVANSDARVTLLSASRNVCNCAWSLTGKLVVTVPQRNKPCPERAGSDHTRWRTKSAEPTHQRAE